jgi:hypothetical protein
LEYRDRRTNSARYRVGLRVTPAFRRMTGPFTL